MSTILIITLILALYGWLSFYLGELYGTFTTIQTYVDYPENFHKIKQSFIELFRG